MAEFQIALQETCLDLAATVFLLSGGAKLVGPRAFREALIYIPYMRLSWTYLVAGILPVAEVVVAVGLFLNLMEAKFAALALLALFAAVVSLVLWKRLRVPCGCFGGLGKRYLSAGNFRDTGLLALATLATMPLPGRTHILQSLATAAFLLLFYVAGLELLRQRRFLTGLRRQGVI